MAGCATRLLTGLFRLAADRLTAPARCGWRVSTAAFVPVASCWGCCCRIRPRRQETSHIDEIFLGGCTICCAQNQLPM